MLCLECSTVCRETCTLTQTERGYGEEWKTSAALTKLLMRKFSGE